MQDEEIRRILDKKEQAYQAMRLIIGVEDIHILTSDIGTHQAIWVTWVDEDGDPRTRQFSWNKGSMTSDGYDLQWMYNAFYDYGTLIMKIKNTTWNDEYEGHNYYI